MNISEKETLIIIGNGFDLAHGLKTSWWDFKDHLKINNPKIYKEITNLLKNDADSFNWNDLEKELSNVDVNYMFSRWEELKDKDYEGYRDVQRPLDTNSEFYLPSNNDINNKSLGYCSMNFINLISNEICFWLKKAENAEELIYDFITNDNFYINFNYTESLEKIYGVNKENIFFIHGTIKDKNIVLGFDELEPKSIEKQEKALCELRIQNNIEIAMGQDAKFSEEEIQEIESCRDIYLKKMCKNPSIIIEQNKDFFDSLKNIKKVVILGHSMGIVDFKYFQEIKLKISVDAIWEVFWYDNTDKEHKEKILKDLEIPIDNIILKELP